jgi:hypothetical protein
MKEKHANEVCASSTFEPRLSSQDSHLIATCECENGVCTTIGDLYFIKNRASDSSTYSSWEAAATTACVCDYGFSGPRCDMRMCPKAFDPINTFAHYYTMNITLYGFDGYLTGYARFRFHQESILIPANAYDWSEDECEESFESLPMLSYVSCVQSDINDVGGAVYTVTIIRYAVLPHENNLFNLQDGLLDDDDNIACDLYTMSGADDLSCSIESYGYSSLPVYEYCSGRGVCDFTSGLCACYSGFDGAACEIFYSPADEVLSNVASDIVSFENTDLSYSFKGSILHLFSNTTNSDDFNFLDIRDSNDSKLMQIDGQGV